MRWTVGVLLALSFAGCMDEVPAFNEPRDGCGEVPTEKFRTGDDRSVESITYTINATGAFTVLVPVLVSAGGSQFEDWRRYASGREPFNAIESERGPAIVLDDTERGLLIACSAQPQNSNGNGCCAEAYLDGVWSTSPDGEVGTGEIFVKVVAGEVERLQVRYAADSNWCDRRGTFEAMNLQPGWHAIQGPEPRSCS